MSKWTKHKLWPILKHNDDQLVKALQRLYEFQTNSEKVTKWTMYHNAVGFNKPDSKRMSTYAIRSFYRKLTYKELAWIRPRMYKYTGQLCRIVNGEQC